MNGKLVYDGEHSNGKLNGKGKAYYINGKLHFDGEFFNDKYWTGKLYDIKGEFRYELKNGKNNNYGKYRIKQFIVFVRSRI